MAAVKKEHYTAQFYIKDPDAFQNLCHELKIPKAKSNKHFEFGEYATLEVTFDRKLNIVSGRVLPL